MVKDCSAAQNARGELRSVCSAFSGDEPSPSGCPSSLRAAPAPAASPRGRNTWAVQAHRGSASGPHPNPRPHPLPSEAEFPEGLRGVSAAFVILSFHVVVFLLDSGNQIMRQRRPGGTSFYSLFGRFFAVPNLLCPQQPIQHQALEKWAIQAPGN